MLPLLTFVGGVPLKLATGKDLVHVFIASATGIFFYHRSGMVDLKAGLYLGISAIGGGLIGSFLSVLLSVHTLQLIYLGVVASAAIVCLFTPLSLEKECYRKGDFHKVFGMAVGLGVGSLAGLLGVGGRFILNPLDGLFSQDSPACNHRDFPHGYFNLIPGNRWCKVRGWTY